MGMKQSVLKPAETVVTTFAVWRGKVLVAEGRQIR